MHPCLTARGTRWTGVFLGIVVLTGCAAPTPAGGGAAGSGPSTSQSPPAPSSPPPVPVLTDPVGVHVVAGGSAADVAAGVVAALFATAPTVVVAGAAPGMPAAAAATAQELGAPVLLEDPTDPARLPGALSRLGATQVLTVGVPAAALTPLLGGARVVEDPAQLAPARRPPASATTVLVAAGDPTSATDSGVLAAPAVTATAHAAGATVITVHGDDPRADPVAVTALVAAPPGPVIAAGARFGPPDRLTGRLAVARTGVQLPGGGQRMFPGRALIALYGHPDAPALGVLGEQDPAGSVTRAQQVAAPYRDLYPVPVVPTFEIIATVASAEPGADGDYSTEASVASLTPLVDAAAQAGMYTVLDLQPGRADLLTQAQQYETLLRRPDVGLGVDPEWALGPDQVPLEQIGSINAAQINEVTTWLADLTATALLPQKLLVLHQSGSP